MRALRALAGLPKGLLKYKYTIVILLIPVALLFAVARSLGTEGLTALATWAGLTQAATPTPTAITVPAKVVTAVPTATPPPATPPPATATPVPMATSVPTASPTPTISTTQGCWSGSLKRWVQPGEEQQNPTWANKCICTPQSCGWVPNR